MMYSKIYEWFLNNICVEEKNNWENNILIQKISTQRNQKWKPCGLIMILIDQEAEMVCIF